MSFLGIFAVLLFTAQCFPDIEAGPAKPKPNAKASKPARNLENLKSEQRIVGGDQAKPNEFPYQLAFEIYGTVLCGAALIHPQWALTAAHCTADVPSSEMKIIGGEHRLSRNEGKEQSIEVAQIIDHPQYKGKAGWFAHDISLLKLKSPMPLSKYIAVIKMAPASFKPSGMTTVTGWGDLKDGADLGSDKLMKVDIPIVPNGDCKTAYNGVHRITDGHICAGYLGKGGKDACQGDSGGPLAIKDKGSPLLIGVVSVGLGCAKAKFPGVFTSVASYRSWIDSYVK